MFSQPRANCFITFVSS